MGILGMIGILDFLLNNFCYYNFCNFCFRTNFKQARP